jgi:Peptidase C39 family
MFPNIIGLIFAAAALALFAVAHRRGRVMSAPIRRRRVALAGLCALPAIYNAVYYLHVLPETALFYEARSWRGAEALMMPAGVAGGLLAAVVPRRMLVLPLLATVGITWGPFLKPVLAPVGAASLHDTWTGPVCIQSTLSSCGPACTATVLRALGDEVREAEVIRAAHTYLGGTEAWYLARFIRSRGLRARFSVGAAGFPGQATLPAVAGVKVDGRGHFIALIARDRDRYRVGDPMVGPETLSREELERRYGFTGFVLEVSR